MQKGGKVKVTVGGWYQRTTLHLSEVYAFLKERRSNLPLSEKKLKEYHKKLQFISVTREYGHLEHIRAVTKTGIVIKYYEDGLYTLEKNSTEILEARKDMKSYLEKKFKPAIAYIFSLGAPTPKVLANIEIEHPTAISIIDQNHTKFKLDTSKYGEPYSKISSPSMTLYKTKDYIFIIANPKLRDVLPRLMGMQIFFREFKDQLEKYLNIHRTVWEEISDIKEKRKLKAKEVHEQRLKLESYQKTVNLIKSRINQMTPYAKTRASLAKNIGIEKAMVELFKYRFEDLFDTLSYIKEIWAMTQDYVKSAIKLIIEMEGRNTSRSIKSIQLLASVGVVAGILRYLTADTVPKVTGLGVGYFVVLLIIAFGINYIIKLRSKNKSYTFKFIERAKKI